jgi:hypothetical protein
MTEYKCPKCQKGFSFPSTLKKHLKTVYHCLMDDDEINEILQVRDNDEKEFKCLKCNKDFSYRHTLLRHNRESKCGKEQLIENQTISSNNDHSNNNHHNTNTNTNSNNNNEITVNNINNLTINNIQHIYPLGYGKLPNMSKEEMKRLLKLGDKGVIDILKLVCEQEENKNFFKHNMNKRDISYLSERYRVDICQESELKERLLKQSVMLTFQMLVACEDILTTNEVVEINLTLQEATKKMKEEIYDNGLKNIIEYELRTNGKNTKDKIIKYTETINTNDDAKQVAIKNVDEVKKQKDQNNSQYKQKISIKRLNRMFGDPYTMDQFKKSNCYNNFYDKLFESTFYYKYWTKRMKDEEQYIKQHPKKTITDLAILDKRIIDIKSKMEMMRKINSSIRSVDSFGNPVYTEENFKIEFATAYSVEQYQKELIGSLMYEEQNSEDEEDKEYNVDYSSSRQLLVT